MTRARAKLLQANVNSLLSLSDFDTPLDGLLLHTHTLCIIRYEEKDPRNGGEATSRCQTQAVLPTGTTGQRYYRPPLLLVTGASDGSSNRCQTQAVLPTGTTGPSGTTGPTTGTTGRW